MSAIYSKNPDVVFRRIAGEFILVPIRQKAVDLKSVYTLNETGAMVWELLDGRRSVGEIGERISGEFDVDAERARSDVSGIISQLEALGLVQKA